MQPNRASNALENLIYHLQLYFLLAAVQRGAFVSLITGKRFFALIMDRMTCDTFIRRAAAHRLSPSIFCWRLISADW